MVFNDKALAPYRGIEPYIFLSYSHRNSEQASRIIRRLNQLHFRVWYDEGLIPGREWDDNIAHVIMGCSYFVALVSADYLASSNCRDELNYARDKDKPLLLIYLEDVALPAGMELRLGRLFAIRQSRYADESAFYTRFFDAVGIERCCAQIPPEIAVRKRKLAEQARTASIPAPANQAAVTEVPSSIPGRKTQGSKGHSGLQVFGIFLLLVLLAGTLIVMVHLFSAPALPPETTYTTATPSPSSAEETDQAAEFEIEPSETDDPAASTEPEATPTPTPVSTSTATPSPAAAVEGDLIIDSETSSGETPSTDSSSSDTDTSSDTTAATDSDMGAGLENESDSDIVIVEGN